MKKAFRVGARIGVVAPSAVVPGLELKLGSERLKKTGFQVQIHPQVRKRDFLFAGSDQERAKAFWTYALDPKIEVLWCARGGYGAMRILPLLKAYSKKSGRKPTKKILVGFSDATAVLDFVRKEWGWTAIHAPMVAQRDFSSLPDGPWNELMNVLGGALGEKSHQSAKEFKLSFLSPKKARVVAPIIGGNLAVINSLVGTDFQLDARGKILFLEEITEPAYRIDRMIQQMLQSGSFEGVRAIVIGTLDQCEDKVPMTLSGKPLRAKFSEKKFISEIFGGLGLELGVPVAIGLPIGHGGGHYPLVLGSKYCLNKNGLFTKI